MTGFTALKINMYLYEYMYKFVFKYFFVCVFGLENSIKLILLEPYDNSCIEIWCKPLNSTI